MLRFAPRVFVLTRIAWVGEPLVSQLEIHGYRARYSKGTPPDGVVRSDIIIGDSSILTPDLVATFHRQKVIVLHLSERSRRDIFPPSTHHLAFDDDLGELLSLMRFVRDTAPRGPTATLTPRQREVLDRVARGETNAEIAAALVVTIGTVKRHLHDIYGILGVRSRSEAAYIVRITESGRREAPRARPQQR